MIRRLFEGLRIVIVLFIALSLAYAGAATNSDAQYKLEARVYYAKIDPNAGARIQCSLYRQIELQGRIGYLDHQPQILGTRIGRLKFQQRTFQND